MVAMSSSSLTSPSPTPSRGSGSSGAYSPPSSSGKWNPGIIIQGIAILAMFILVTLSSYIVGKHIGLAADMMTSPGVRSSRKIRRTDRDERKSLEKELKTLTDEYTDFTNAMPKGGGGNDNQGNKKLLSVTDEEFWRQDNGERRNSPNVNGPMTDEEVRNKEAREMRRWQETKSRNSDRQN